MCDWMYEYVFVFDWVFMYVGEKVWVSEYEYIWVCFVCEWICGYVYVSVFMCVSKFVSMLWVNVGLFLSLLICECVYVNEYVSVCKYEYVYV